MRHVLRKLWLLSISVAFSSVQAAICPDPNNSSLSWGEVPKPWVVNPFSEQTPQGEVGARFKRANILVAGVIGRGVVCAYQNSLGVYSIWWPVNVKVPARVDYLWRDTLGGFECTDSLETCVFYPGSTR